MRIAVSASRSASRHQQQTAPRVSDAGWLAPFPIAARVRRRFPRAPNIMQPSRDISRLIEIMAALRNPNGGCPWDLEQDFSSIRHYTIEEAYEVSDAIERQDWADLREELGD